MRLKRRYVQLTGKLRSGLPCPKCGATTGPCRRWIKGAEYWQPIKTRHKERPK